MSVIAFIVFIVFKKIQYSIFKYSVFKTYGDVTICKIILEPNISTPLHRKFECPKNHQYHLQELICSHLYQHRNNSTIQFGCNSSDYKNFVFDKLQLETQGQLSLIISGECQWSVAQMWCNTQRGKLPAYARDIFNSVTWVGLWGIACIMVQDDYRL